MRRLAATLVLILLYGALLEAASAQTTEAPAITSAGPFEVNEGTTAVATLVADDDDTTADNLTWTTTGGADSASFTLSTAGVLAFVAAKDYEVPDDAGGDGSYEVTVQVSDGVNTDSADLVVTLVNVIELIDITGPASPTIGENDFGRVATYSASSDADRSGISWSLSGADAADFSIDAPPGALRFAITPASPNRFKQAADYENPADGGTDNTYNVTVTASVTDGGSKTLDVAVTVTDVDEAGAITLSATQPRVGTALTATLSDPDAVTAGTTNWQWERNNGREGWLAISGATAATYTPTAADGDRYLRVKATYTDGFGAGKSAETTATRVVIAHRLNSLTFHGLTGVTNDSRASYPAFSSDTLHYAARCSETVEMTVVSANTGTRIAVNGVQRTSGERFSVSGLGSETEIRIVLSGAAGGSTTYTVHCLDRASFPRLTTTTSAGASDELWLFQTKWEPPETGALIAMDHNGVPRWHRIIDDELLAYFQAHPDASSPFGYYSYAKRGSSFDTTGYEIVILDKYFSLVQGDIHIRSPFNTTDFHDQYVLPNGNAVIMAYSRHARDVRFMNRMYPTMTDEDGGTLAASEPMRDSAIQVQTRNGGTVFNWSSWDHMAMTDCVYANNQLRWEYAHINSLSYHDGDIIAGFRHCSKILRIDLETGRVVWRAGPSVNSRADWVAGRLLQPNRGPAPLEFVNDPRNGFSGQHSGEITRDGTLLVYDNATHCTLPVDALVREGGRGLAECGERTRGVEYAFDLDNHELIFLREYRMPGETQGGWGGHAIPLPNGNWIISWSQQRALPATAVEVNPRTGAQVVSLDLANIAGTRNVGRRYPTRVSSVTPVALATAIEELEATVVSHPGFHGGAGATESPSVVVAFNRPIVDPTAGSPSVVVSGATVASVAAHEQAGAPANAYRFTLTPGGDGRITFSLATGKTCSSDGICTADGATLSKAPAAIQILGPGTVSFGSAAYRVSEGGSVNVQVRLSAAHQGSEPVVVPVALGTASTATADEYDYAASVSFASGETVKTVTLSAANDTLVEGDESVVIEFGTLPTGISAGTQATTTVTLTDTDRATISFSLGRSQVAEGGSTDLTFAITNGVTFQADQEITLSVSGSASDDDYTLSEQLTLSAGETSASTSLSVTDDAALETAETVTVRATIGAASTLIGTRTVTIPPSDVPNVPTVSIVPGADAAEGAAATFTLTRTESTSRPLSSALTVAIQVGVTDVQLSGSAPNRVTFAAGEADAELSIGTRDDTLISDAGAVSVLVAASTSNPPAYLVDTGNSASVSIIDNDTPAFRISPETADLAESRSLTVTVQTDGVTFAAPQTITATLAGTATANEGVDFELLGQDGDAGSAPLELTLAARATSARLRVNALRDPEDDAGETVVISFAHDGVTIGMATLTLREAPPPSISFAGGGFGVGGGGGGPAGPTPSTEDFEWTVKHDIEELEAGHDVPTGMWSDGATLWLLQNGSSANDAVHAYDLGTGERAEEREFELDGRNRAPRGIWSDGETVWISDSGRDQLFAHELASGERLPGRDLTLASRNADARGIWSDGQTMWVLDGGKDSLFAYALAGGDLLGEYGLDSANSDPHGIWSDGVGVWVSNHDPKRLLAYRLPAPPGGDEPRDGERALDRVRDEDFTELSGASNNSPRGIWSDGTVMYVADELDGKVYTYNMPDAIDARLATLTLSGVEIGAFDPATTDYEGAPGEDVTGTTVEAAAVQRRATVVIDPPDADAETGGHQVTIEGVEEVTVSVTSGDGSRTRVYRVTLPAPADEGPCLRGAVAEGYSLVVHEGGSVEELVACAEERHVTALYVLHKGGWVSYIPGAPDFVNAGFRELYADGVPALTPLVVGSEGPATAAPAARDADTAAWAACLRGELADGYSLVVYEGGSVGELAACAEELGVAALYTLQDGEWVAYIPGAPAFVSAAFGEHFAEGVPAATPLVVAR